MRKSARAGRIVFVLLFLSACSCGGDTDNPDAGFDSGPSIDAGDSGVTLCAAARDCDDGRFCNGTETCSPGAPGAGADGCVEGTPPCAMDACDESAERCDCGAESDADSDGHDSTACGGDDCDDDDGNRYPGNEEVCDAEGHDEDCDPTTLAAEGEADEDGDGSVSSACCNGTECGSDCNDARRDVYPGATEACNTVDDDCDGVTDGPEAFCPVGTCIDRRCRSVAWEQVYGGPLPDDVTAVGADSGGNVYFLMSSGGGIDLDDDGSDEDPGWYAVSLSPEGRFRWAEPMTIVGLGREGFAVAPSEDSIVVAVSGQELDWLSTTDGSSVRSTPVDPPAGWDSIFIGGLAWSRDQLYVAAAATRGSGASEEYALCFIRYNADGTEAGRRVIPTNMTRPLLRGFDVNGAGGGVFAVEVSSAVDLGGGDVGPGTVLGRLAPDLARGVELTLPLESAGGPRVDVAAVALSSADEIGFVGSYSGAPALPWGDSWPDAGASDSDAFASVIAPDDSHRWTEIHDGPLPEGFQQVSFDERGGLVVSGSFSGELDVSPHGRWTASGIRDGFVAVWDVTDGFTLDARRFTGTGAEETAGVFTDAFGSSVIVGRFSGRVTLLRGEYDSVGGLDVFVIRMSDAP